jgi:hypothetical protein
VVNIQHRVHFWGEHTGMEFWRLLFVYSTACLDKHKKLTRLIFIIFELPVLIAFSSNLRQPAKENFMPVIELPSEKYLNISSSAFLCREKGPDNGEGIIIRIRCD